MTLPHPDDAILCDVCGKLSGMSDPREPWHRDDKHNPKPEWRCDICVKAVDDAREQRGLYQSISFPNKEAEEKYNKRMEELGFYTIYEGPAINMSEAKRRRFK